MRAKKQKQEQDRLVVYLAITLSFLEAMTIIALFGASDKLAAAATLLRYLPPMP